MRTALILTGAGRYADAWHPFAETTEELASLVAAQGYAVTTRGDVDAALTELATRSHLPDLVVTNVGLPRDGEASPGSVDAAAGIRRIFQSMIPVLAMHSSSTSFTGSPEWEDLIGGRWIRNVSMHPDYGNATIVVKSNAHPITLGRQNFMIQDERYSYLRSSPRVSILAVHEHDGVEHPILWAHTRRSGGKAVYDALGHDGASYHSEAHTHLIRSALEWLQRNEKAPGAAP